LDDSSFILLVYQEHFHQIITDLLCFHLGCKSRTLLVKVGQTIVKVGHLLVKVGQTIVKVGHGTFLKPRQSMATELFFAL
jgi:hypothetical protein